MATITDIQEPLVTDDGGGGAPPAGYKPTTPQIRSQWNGFVDYLKNQGNINLSDPQIPLNFLSQYKQNNPDFSITPEMIPAIQYENNQLRTGESFGSLNTDQLKAVRQGLSPNFLNTNDVYKSYYPQFKSGSQDFGTNIEDYAKSKFSGNVPTQALPAQASPSSAAANPIYTNHDTALKRVNQLASIPGNEFLHGRGDALINANYIPNTDTQSFKESSSKAAKSVGLDPEMFWASAAEEGATGLIPDKNGRVNTDEKIDLDGKYPVSGFTNFGVDNFHDNFKELVKRGYLPNDFDYKKSVHVNEQGETVNSGDFKSVQDALTAKAAFVRMERDNLDSWSNTNKVKLSPTANQFFTFIAYNGGPGTAHKLINYYKAKGLLEGDKFLDSPPPKSVDPGGSFIKVQPRYKVAKLLKQEKVFE